MTTIGPDLPKYPRTHHIDGSKGITDPNCVALPTTGSFVVEEKVDGSCVSISFSDDELFIYHRNNSASGQEFQKLREWLSSIELDLYCTLEERYIMYGEWLYAKHTIYYDNLPSYFLEYDIYDKTSGYFLSTPKRLDLIKGLSINSVKVVSTGEFANNNFQSLIGRSNYITADQKANLTTALGLDNQAEVNYSDVSGLMEGLYIKAEDEEKVLGRYKYIRKEFVDRIIQSGHWNKRKLVPNSLGELSSARAGPSA